MDIENIVKEFEDYKASLFTLDNLPAKLLEKIFRFVEVIEDTYPALEYSLPIFALFGVSKQFFKIGWKSMEGRFVDDKYMIWRLLWRNPIEVILRRMIEINSIDMTTRSVDVFTYTCGAGYTDLVETLLADSRVSPSRYGNEALKNASANGHVEVVRLLLKDKRVNPPDTDENSAIRNAAKEGQYSVVKLLMEDHRVNPADNDNEAIINASSNGHVETVELLLSDKRVDCGARQNESIRRASKNGHYRVVEALLKNRKCDPACENNESIREASSNNRVKVVKILLGDERVDPTAWENMTLRIAAEKGHLKLMQLLLDDERVNPADLGNEALCRASREGMMEVVKVLLDDYRVLFSDGLDEASDAAMNKGHTDIMELIKRREANREVFKEAKELFSKIKEKLSKEMRAFTQGTNSIVKLRQVVQALNDEKSKLMSRMDKEDMPERMKTLDRELEKELSSIREIGVFGRETHIYFGNVENDRPHGKGTIYVEKKSGFSTKIRIMYEGEFFEGQRQGEGIENYDKGKGNVMRYRGDWVKGKKEGQGTEYYYPSGEVAYQGSWKAGKRHGPGVFYTQSGKKVKNKRKTLGTSNSLKMDEGVLKGEWRFGNLYKIDVGSVRLEEVDFSKLHKFFKRKRKIGQGAYGEVFRVIYKGKKCAAKVLNVSSQFKEVIIARTEETLKLCASLHHPQIIKILGWSKKGEVGYLMELCSNSVADLVQKSIMSRKAEATNTLEGPKFVLDMNEKVKFIYQTALGMRYLHEHSIMHRDLKWENILLSSEGDIRITDFDFAYDEIQICSVNMSSVGTPAFIAPEVVKGIDYSNKCDVYSFALMIYCLVFETLMPYQGLKRCVCGISQFSSLTFLQHVCNCNLRPPVPGPIGMPTQRWKWIVDLMFVCWDGNVSKRPDFCQIVDIIESNMKNQKLFCMVNIRTTKQVDSDSEKFLLTNLTIEGLRNSVERRWKSEDIDRLYIMTELGLVELRNDEQIMKLDNKSMIVVRLFEYEEEEKASLESLEKKIEELEFDSDELRKKCVDLKESNDKLKKENHEIRMVVREQEREVTNFRNESKYLRDLNDKLVKILQEQKNSSINNEADDLARKIDDDGEGKGGVLTAEGF